MTASLVNRILKPYGQGARPVTMPVGVYHLFSGNMVSQLAASPGSLCPAATALSGAAIGMMVHEVDNSGGSAGDLRGQMLTDGIFVLTNSVGDPCAETTAFGALVYCENDYTVSKTNGGAQFAAGYFVGMEPDGGVRVYISPRALNPADLATLATSAGAGDIGILDAGGFTAQTTVEAALQELYQQAETANASFGVPLASMLDPDGDPLAKYSAGNTGVAGFTLANSKAVAIEWNNYPSNPGMIVIGEFAMPKDLDDTANMVLEFLCSKTGATSGDATKITVGAFITAAGDLHDAPSDVGGDTDAMVGAATAKTTQLLTRTITAANIQAGAVSCSFTLMPKSGTIETDDFILHAMRVRYKRKIQTS